MPPKSNKKPPNKNSSLKFPDRYLYSRETTKIFEEFKDLFNPLDIDPKNRSQVFKCCDLVAQRFAQTNKDWANCKFSAKNWTEPTLHGLYKAVLSIVQQAHEFGVDGV